MAKKKKKKKKDPQPAQQDQTFNSPFAALGKGLKKSLPDRDKPAPPPKPKAQAPPDDERIFAMAMSGVEHLDGGGRTVPAAGEPAPAKMELGPDEELEVMARLADLVSGVEDFDLRFSDLYVEGCQPGVGPELVRRLRQGAFPIQDHLDLHGLSLDEAQVEAQDFIMACVTKGLRHVLIVHGKGKGSPGGVPVLKKALTDWLAVKRFRKNVLAFCSAQAMDGGTGAIYLLLRRWTGPGRPQSFK
jgi:DNA-nicking Smr family endonuclease